MSKMKQGVSFHRDSMHEDTASFQSALLPYMGGYYRDLPWRNLSEDVDQRFYEVLVSEIMLQQTQVKRVMEKYVQWMSRFPTLHSLAIAGFSEVLSQWSGLGYTRRAKYLSDIAKQLDGAMLPISANKLAMYKGIGINTAGAVFAYYKNEPCIFIETNIRTVLFHHFFNNQSNISDRDLLPYIENLIDTSNPRAWYWALMDYGSVLKKQTKNIHQSKHYKKQSKFEGSDRQLRATLLRKLMDSDLNIGEAISSVENKRYIIDMLLKDGMAFLDGDSLMLPK